jgi:hypothetical protein
MEAADLRSLQAPLKDAYRRDPRAAFITLKARGTLAGQDIACKVDTGRALASAGLHPATGVVYQTIRHGPRVTIALERA